MFRNVSALLITLLSSPQRSLQQVRRGDETRGGNFYKGKGEVSDGEEGLDVERRGKDANKRLKDEREEVEAPNVIARWRDEDR